MSSDRKPIGKRLRFEIFKRDSFRCIYCGATPLQSPLHVDHVVAVAGGGSDDPANLVTSCDACNLGKSAVPLEQRALKSRVDSEAEHEQPEQLRAYLALQREIAKAKSAVVEELESYWLEQIGLEPQDMLRARLPSLVQEFGLAKLMEAIDIVARKNIRSSYEPTAQRNQAQYFHGILRKWRDGGQR